MAAGSCTTPARHCTSGTQNRGLTLEATDIRRQPEPILLGCRGTAASNRWVSAAASGSEARAPSVDVRELDLDALRHAGLRVVQIVADGRVGGGGEAAALHEGALGCTAAAQVGRFPQILEPMLND